MAGCGPSKKERAPEAERASTATESMPSLDEGPLVIDAPAPGMNRDDAALSEADRAWKEFEESTHTPDPPESWLTSKPAEEEVNAFKQKVADQLVNAADKAHAFYTRFPEHAEAAEARRQEIGLLNFAVQLGRTNVAARSQTLESARLKDPNLPEDERLELRIQQLQREMSTRETTNKAGAFAELEKGVRALKQDFPKRTEAWGLMLFTAERWLEINDAAKAKALTDEVLAAKLDDELDAAARELQKKAERLGKPAEIKFTATDGREVDLEKLRGKVVLVDFWATWCRPCMAELPKVKAAYDKLHAKGFEIVGLSFDRDRKALDRVLKEESMAWPQYFESEKAENRFGEAFGISSIPTMWLVDKRGMVRDLNAREDLVEKVEKLLAE